MSKTDTSSIIFETWEILREYIPSKETRDAAEHLVTFYQSILSPKEMLEMVEQDDDLMEAYEEIVEPEPEDEDDEYE